MNNEINFNNQETILSEGKKKFYSLKMIECLPAIDFGLEYSIRNNKATVIIYTFETSGDDKFTVFGVLGLISSFIYETLLKPYVSSNNDLCFFLRVIRDNPNDNETVYLENRLKRSRNIDDTFFLEFSEPVSISLGINHETFKRSSDNEIIELIRNIQSDFNNRPVYKDTYEGKQDYIEIEKRMIKENFSLLTGLK